MERLKGVAPGWMVDRPSSDNTVDPGTPVAPPVASAPAQAVSSVSVDTSRVEEIISLLVKEVPEFGDILAQADKLKAKEPDPQRRIELVMLLSGTSAEAAANIVLRLRDKLKAIRDQGQQELAQHRQEQVDLPNQQIAGLEAEKARLTAQIGEIDGQTVALRQSVQTALEAIARETGRFESVVIQAESWIGNVAQQLKAS